MFSTVTAETSSASGNLVPERSAAEVDVRSSTWLVGFSLVVVRAVEGAEGSDMIHFASLWTSRAEDEQSGLVVKLSPEHAVLFGQLWSIARCMMARSARILLSLSSQVRAATNEVFPTVLIE